MSIGEVFGFNHVFRNEISVINARRAGQEPKRPAIVLSDEAATDSTGEPVLGPDDDATVVGLALSGGGIRSAAFCLGALQALNEANVLKRIDYLSTVSGGGYIGCSLSAGLEATKGEFPFESRVVEDETPSLQHLRDYSNYLFPNGAVDVLHNASIYVRGVVANFVLIMPFLLIAAAVTILLNPTITDLGLPNLLGLRVLNIFEFDNFVVTTYLSLLLLVFGVAWGLLRSLAVSQNSSEVPGGLTTFVGWAVLVVLFSAFCELQPFVLAAMFKADLSGFSAASFKLINKISLALSPIAAVIAFLGSKLGEFVKSAKESSRTRAQIAGYAAKAAIYFAAIVIPFLLWVVYLNLSYLGICINSQEGNCEPPHQLPLIASRLFADPHNKLYLLVIVGYLLIAASFLVLTLFLRPNANSLHPLYRDRLGKAFLFEPQPTLQQNAELAPSRLHLSQLSGMCGPYHLINTALNIQNSKTANKRGRNADFFLLSQNFIGSETTGYVLTKDVEKITPALNLATAMAVSGAAASSNMGAQSIKPLTPTLAIMNIRLGFWLRNPLWVAKGGLRNIWANFYFLLELLGLLNERRKSVYLTDGGHIENLGVYELLKRRCRVIIAVDAEADPEMAFGSFNTLVRYARIDLGLEIDLPWQQTTNATRATSDAIDEHGDCPKLKGPHCAIGEIAYPCGRKGVLIYIKSSLTGDENDYVFHYRKRYSAFPHETTLDQMFSEEQFEAYRALGYHAAYGLFDRRDAFAHLDPAENPLVRGQLDLLDRLFPHVTTGGAPGQRLRFAEWLPEAPVENRTEAT
jgi:Patatin-like phospholipase